MAINLNVASTAKVAVKNYVSSSNSSSSSTSHDDDIRKNINK